MGLISIQLLALIFEYECILLMKFVRSLDFPHLGKLLLLLLAITESAVYLSLAIEYQRESTSFLLSLALLLASATSVLLTALSIPAKVYYYHTRVYVVAAVVAVGARIATMIAINKVNGEPSEEFYLTEDGFLGLLQTALIFEALNCLLIYEKTHYYRTQASVQEKMVLP